MKLSKDFLLHHNGEESLVVSTGNAAFAGLVDGSLIIFLCICG